MTAHLGPKPSDDDSPLAGAWNEIRKLMHGKQLDTAVIEIVAFGFFYGARTVLYGLAPDRNRNTFRNMAREITFLEGEIMPAKKVEGGNVRTENPGNNGDAAAPAATETIRATPQGAVPGNLS